jgi:hypothetical protein
MRKDLFISLLDNVIFAYSQMAKRAKEKEDYCELLVLKERQSALRYALDVYNSVKEQKRTKTHAKTHEDTEST